MTDELPVADHLLLPLLEVAADTLRSLDAADVPPRLRHLHGFDRRGLMHGPGPRQLRRALVDDEGFRERVYKIFTDLPQVSVLVTQWSEGEPAAFVESMAQRDDLALLASVLWACHPPQAEFGLGLVVERDARERLERGDEAAARARAKQIDKSDEARRRSDAARMEAEADAARAAESLRQERNARREREARAEAAAAEATARADALAEELEKTRQAVEEERARTAREAARGRALERDLARTRSELAAALARADQVSRLDPRDADKLTDAVTILQRTATSLEALRRKTRSDQQVPDGADEPRDAPLVRRVQPTVAPGTVADSAAGIEAMLRTRGVLLVVDGYNVTKRAWPDSTASDQRERLGVAITGLHRRLGCDVLVVFDGDGTNTIPALRRGGVRVIFSAADEEADEVIVREVEALPKRVPVVVASSDAWVRDHVVEQGAVAIGADALLRFMKPGREGG